MADLFFAVVPRTQDSLTVSCLEQIVLLAWCVFDAPQHGRLAQLGERGVRNAEVTGSIPVPSTTIRFQLELPPAVRCLAD